MTRYLYSATALLLAIFYGAAVVTVNALLRLLSGIESDIQTRQTLATGLGVLVVTGPLWWLHWRGLRWHIEHTAVPAAQQHYRTYLAVVAGLAIVAIFSSAGASVTLFMRIALGLRQAGQPGWTQGLPWMIALLAATVIWWLHWQPLMGSALANPSQQAPKHKPSLRSIPVARGSRG